jgi:hypothetical protein
LPCFTLTLRRMRFKAVTSIITGTAGESISTAIPAAGKSSGLSLTLRNKTANSVLKREVRRPSVPTLFSNPVSSRVFPASPIADLGALGVTWTRGLTARQAHNLKVVSSNLAPATKIKPAVSMRWRVFLLYQTARKIGLGNTWVTDGKEIAGYPQNLRHARSLCGGAPPTWHISFEAMKLLWQG